MVPLEGREYDAEACAGGGRSIAERGAVDEHEHLFAVGVLNEAIAAEGAFVYLNREQLGERGGRRWGDEHALGVGDGIGDWCGEMHGTRPRRTVDGADWRFGKLGKGHGGGG